MSKKILSLLLALVMAFVMASCTTPNKNEGESEPQSGAPLPAVSELAPIVAPEGFEAPEDFKLGVILLHDENSTYDLNFMNGVAAAKQALGLTDEQVIIKKDIPESNACYEAALDLVDDGCDLIFANSFGHESHLIEAAKACPKVQFCHATGTSASSAGLANFHNAFASIYEGRYLAGVAAGLKLNEMIAAGKFTAEEAKIGYVGAFTYAEVISGYTSFYLGVKSVCPTVTMEVQFTGEWYDETAEKNTANALIERGCKLISQHADSMGAPSACEEKQIPNVSYNGSTAALCPNTFIVSSRIDWAPYFTYICLAVAQGSEIATDWCGTMVTASVALTDLGANAPADGTAEKLAEVKAKLQSGELRVFDTNTFTVGGQKLTSCVKYGYEVVADGYFHESEAISAPYFDLKIDGITLLNEEF